MRKKTITNAKELVLNAEGFVFNFVAYFNL